MDVMCTDDVMKWYRKTNTKSSDLFVKRMRQLASGEGERSPILKKRLVGCRLAIYETCWLSSLPQGRGLFRCVF